MGKKNEIETTQAIVLDILKKHPEARNSDNRLFYLVYKQIGATKGIDLDCTSITRFFLCMKDYGFPSIETIRRTRQKIQAEDRSLCGNSTVEGHRLLNEEVFREYANR